MFYLYIKCDKDFFSVFSAVFSWHKQEKQNVVPRTINKWTNIEWVFVCVCIYIYIHIYIYIPSWFLLKQKKIFKKLTITIRKIVRGWNTIDDGNVAGITTKAK